jgi:hypothetical protein
MDQYWSKAAVDSSVKDFVGISQRAARDFTPISCTVSLPSHGSKTARDIMQTFTISQPDERRTWKLVISCKKRTL